MLREGAGLSRPFSPSALASSWGFGFILRRFFTVSSNDAIDPPPFTLPPNLSVEQQIVMCVGQLVASWAVCETVLRGIYVVLTCCAKEPDRQYAELSWLSLRDSKSRRDMLMRATQLSSLPQNFKAEIFYLLDRFKTVSETRNFYCHASYVANPKTYELTDIEGYRLTLDDRVISFTKKPSNKATINELMISIRNCESLNREIFGFLLSLEDELGAQLPELRELPLGYPSNPRFPRQQKA